MLKTLRASILILALFSSTYAGEIGFGSPAPPPPPPPTSIAEGSETQNDELDATTEIITALLGSLLALF